jgi:hypothetical protein
MLTVYQSPPMKAIIKLFRKILGAGPQAIVIIDITSLFGVEF